MNHGLFPPRILALLSDTAPPSMSPRALQRLRGLRRTEPLLVAEPRAQAGHAARGDGGTNIEWPDVPPKRMESFGGETGRLTFFRF